jgi:anti-anti-sigma regulatory factor
MSASFRLKTDRTGSELNIILQGDFDGDSAWELVNALMLKNDDCTSVRIDTRQVHQVEPFGAALMKNLLTPGLVRSGRIYFDGIPAAQATEGGHRLFRGDKTTRRGVGCRSRASIR